MIDQYISIMDSSLGLFVLFVVISAIFEMTILKKIATSSENGKNFQKKYEFIRQIICIAYTALYFISLALYYL